MKISDLCKAAIEYSDNGAMNILINQLGGINNVNAYARSIGDKNFILNRYEPELNTAIPNDIRDTTTPKSMAISLKYLTLNNKLLEMLKNNTTGDKKIRAGVLKNWTVGDKTGLGDYGANNDIAIIFPNNCSPIILSIYTRQFQKIAKTSDYIISQITKWSLQELAKSNKCIKYY